MNRFVPDAAALEELGRTLGRLARAGDAVALIGPLGAGKTTLVQGMAEGLGVDEEVTSPTFALMNVYDGRLPVYHLDVYRLDDDSRLQMLGYEAELADAGVTLVEWADKVWPFWTRDVLRIELQPEGEGRRLTATAGGSRSRALLEQLDV